MDEQKNSQSNPQNVPSGFDSVSNIERPTENFGFNPTPMFSKMQNNTNKGYTVTPEGGFFGATPDAPDDSVSSPKTDDKTVDSANVKEEPSADASVSSQTSMHDFLPNGTYSYSAAKGNLPDSAVNEPVIQAAASNFDAEVHAETQSNPQPEPKPSYNYYSPKNPNKQKKVKKSKTKKYGSGVIVACVILAAIIGFGSGIGGTYYMLKNQSSTQLISSDNTSQSITTINIDETVNSTTEAVAKKAGPSVIGIRTTAAVTNFFFGTSESTEEGSGIIYTSDGYIITNYHVIESAVKSSNSKVEVFLPEDTENSMAATVVGYNISYDLAVVKVQSTGLTAIEFGDSDGLTVGQQVVAIGNPGGLEFIGSVSTGVISGLNRSVTVDTGATMSLIQTDAAINPGNSGGALVNSSGQLVGVNSVKLVSESYEGMGFAIPSNAVKEICNKIISKENEPTPYIGIQISQTYTADELKSLGYPAGAVVISVVDGAPASNAGIQRGDIITEFNGTEIINYTDLDGAIADCQPGNSVSVKLYRAGRFYSTTVTIEANNAQ